MSPSVARRQRNRASGVTLRFLRERDGVHQRWGGRSADASHTLSPKSDCVISGRATPPRTASTKSSTHVRTYTCVPIAAAKLFIGAEEREVYNAQLLCRTALLRRRVPRSRTSPSRKEILRDAQANSRRDNGFPGMSPRDEERTRSTETAAGGGRVRYRPERERMQQIVSRAKAKRSAHTFAFLFNTLALLGVSKR